MVRTKKTAILTRARPLFFCSRREPCGSSGLVLFMLFKRCGVYCIEVFVWGWFVSPRGFPSKNPEANFLKRTKLEAMPSSKNSWLHFCFINILSLLFTIYIVDAGVSTPTY